MLQGLYPLLDCTCQIIASADLRKEDFFIFANSIFPLVVGISLTIGSFVVANSANPSSVSLQETILSYESEYDILVVVLDLLASFFSLCSGESTSILIESKFIQTIVSMQIQIQLALSLAFRSSTDVRQSAFAVVGEVCRSIDLMVPIFGQNQDLLSLILRAMVISFDPESPSANTSCASNALWALSLLYTSYSSKPMQSDLNSNYQRTIQSAYVNFRLTGLTKSLDILLLAHSVHILTILTPLLMSSVSPGPKNLLIRSRRLPASYLDNLACAYGSVLGFTLLMSDRSLKISVVNENCLRCWCTLILAVPCVSERETTVLSVVNGIFQIDEPVNHEIAELIADLLRNFLQRSNTTRLFQESVAKFNA